MEGSVLIAFPSEVPVEVKIISEIDLALGQKMDSC